MNAKPSRRKPDQITCLYEVTTAIHSTLDLRRALYKVLDLLSQHLGMDRGSITLLNPETSEIHIEVAHGISQAAKSRGRYKLGEGITGKVIESGKPIAVPDINAEPLFLARTGVRARPDKAKISFICVPVKEGPRVIGALSVDRVFENAAPLEEDVKTLTVISSLIAQKVGLLERINAEKEQLNDENLRLRKELRRVL